MPTGDPMPDTREYFHIPTTPCPICTQAKPAELRPSAGLLSAQIERLDELMTEAYDEIDNLRDDMKQEFREVNKRLVALEATVKQGEPAGPWLDTPTEGGATHFGPLPCTIEDLSGSITLRNDLKGHWAKSADAPVPMPAPWPVGAVVALKIAGRQDDTLAYYLGTFDDNNNKYFIPNMGVQFSHPDIVPVKLIAVPPGHIAPEVEKDIARLKQQVLDYEETGRSIATKLNAKLKQYEARLAQFDELVERANGRIPSHMGGDSSSMLISDLAKMKEGHENIPEVKEQINTLQDQLLAWANLHQKTNSTISKYEALAERADYGMHHTTDFDSLQLMADLAKMVQK